MLWLNPLLYYQDFSLATCRGGLPSDEATWYSSKPMSCNNMKSSWPDIGCPEEATPLQPLGPLACVQDSSERCPVVDLRLNNLRSTGHSAGIQPQMKMTPGSAHVQLMRWIEAHVLSESALSLKK